MTLYVKDGGVWKQPQDVYIKQNGAWTRIEGGIYIKDTGNWFKAYPESGSQSYTTPGTYSLTVPAGVYSMTVSVYAGGASGSACWFCGDGYPGGGGGSGGYRQNQSLSVTSGETLSIVVGAGGAYKPFVVCGGNPPGNRGGDSSVTSSSGSVSATGGYGGTSGQPGGGGAGGSPNGASGSGGVMPYYGGAGGNNGTGYGTGGQGGNILVPDSQKGGNPGYAGAVFISW
jgi:hypothetical protein